MISRSRFCCILISLLLPVSILAAGNFVPLDKVVATVNNSVLTQNQVNDNMQSIKQQLQGTGQPVPSDAVLRKKATDQAIGEILQMQVAQRANVTVSDAEVSNAIASVAKQNNLTADQLKDALKKQGINYTHYRTRIHDQILLRKVQQGALAGKINVSVSDAEVSAYMKKMPPSPATPGTIYHLEDLLIPLNSDATPSAVDTANQQAADLVKKARSAKAAPLSQLAQDSIKYTDLGWRTAKDLPGVFTGVVNGMKAGDVKGPVKAPNGLHILRLTDLRGPANSINPAQVKQILMEQKVEAQVDKWVQELRQKSYIKFM